MNKVELIEALAKKAGVTKQSAKTMLEAYTDIITEQLSQKDEIVLVGFGTFSPRSQNTRLARNPRTGEPVLIKPRTTVKFKPGKYLLQAMNTPDKV